MKKKYLCVLMSILMVMSIPTFAFADSDEVMDGEVENPVVLDFRDYSYTMDDTSMDEVYVVKTADDNEKIEYEIHYIDDETLVEKVRVDFESNNNEGVTTRSVNDTRSTFFSKYYTVKTSSGKAVAKLVFKTRVDLYESGSFKAFYGADTPNLLMAEGITTFELRNVSKSIKSKTGKFPTSDLTYAFSANVRTATTHSTSSSIGIDLAGAKFSKSSSTAKNVYYNKVVSNTGTISLY